MIEPPPKYLPRLTLAHSVGLGDTVSRVLEGSKLVHTWLRFSIPREQCPEGGHLTLSADLDGTVLWEKSYRVRWKQSMPFLDEVSRKAPVAVEPRPRRSARALTRDRGSPHLRSNPTGNLPWPFACLASARTRLAARGRVGTTRRTPAGPAGPKQRKHWGRERSLPGCANTASGPAV